MPKLNDTNEVIKPTATGSDEGEMRPHEAGVTEIGRYLHIEGFKP